MVRSLRGVYIDPGTSSGRNKIVADIFSVGTFGCHFFPDNERVSVRRFQWRSPEQKNSTGVPAKLY